jgi:ABC-type uncharacterized transport system substrate-binding protein
MAFRLRLPGRLFAAAILLFASVAASGCSDDSPPAPEETPADAKPRVFIVHSYDNGYRWTAKQQEGILQGLEEGGFEEGDYELRVFYMDTRVNFVTAEQIALRTDIARRTIDEFEPQLVFLTDDLAVEEVALPYLEDHPDTRISFVFSGVNGDPSRYAPVRGTGIPSAPITGTVERIPFFQALDAVERVFSPVSRVVLLGDDSPSSRAVVDSFRKAVQEQQGGANAAHVTDFVLIDNFEEWKQEIASQRSKVDAIGLLNYHRIKDQSGNIANPKDVARWTVENSDKPVFGLISDWSADGLIMSFGNSGFGTGAYIGRLGADILGGKNAGTIAIVDPQRYEMTFNSTTAEKLNFDIPPSELAKASETFK